MRGHPKNIFSDNGTNLTGAQRELAKSLKSLDQDKIEAKLTPQKYQLEFYPTSKLIDELCHGSYSKNNKETFKYFYQKSSF